RQCNCQSYCSKSADCSPTRNQVAPHVWRAPASLSVRASVRSGGGHVMSAQCTECGRSSPTCLESISSRPDGLLANTCLGTRRLRWRCSRTSSPPNPRRTDRTPNTSTLHDQVLRLLGRDYTNHQI